MDGKLFIPYVDLSSPTLEGTTHFYTNNRTDFSKDISTEGTDVNLIIWTMKYYQLWDFNINNGTIELPPLEDGGNPINPRLSTTFAIHFNFGENTCDLNPSDNSEDPTQGTYDHVDILPLECRYRYDLHDESTDAHSEINWDHVNLSFEHMNRAIPIRQQGILDSERNIWSQFGDQPSQEGILEYVVLGEPNNVVNLPEIHIDDAVGRTRFLVNALKNNHIYCGFGNKDWAGSFVSGGYHPKYCDWANNSGNVENWNYSILMRHLCAMTHPMNFGNGYLWSPAYGNYEVALNSIMWGSFASTGHFMPETPDEKPWYPKIDYIGALDMTPAQKNAVFGVYNKLTFWHKDGGKNGDFDFWFGDIGANYAAKCGLNNCNNYSDHGLFVFNKSANGHLGNIGVGQKFNFMIVPSFYELNMAIDIISNNSENGFLKYKMRDHGLNGTNDKLSFPLPNGQNGHLKTCHPDYNPSDPLANSNYNYTDQCKIIQLFHCGTEPAQWGPDNYSPF